MTDPDREAAVERLVEAAQMALVTLEEVKQFFPPEGAERIEGVQRELAAALAATTPEGEDGLCPACTGSGMETTDPEDASRCLVCNGTGKA